MSENNFLQSIIDTEALAEEILDKAGKEALKIADKARDQVASVSSKATADLADSRRKAHEAATAKADSLRSEILDLAEKEAAAEKEKISKNLDKASKKVSERILEIIGHS